MLESKIEKAYCQEVKKRGGITIKMVSPSMIGLPDRMIILPKVPIYFIEFKRPGEKPRKIQQVIIRKLRELGVIVYVVSTLTPISDSGYPTHFDPS
jgi:hypothetical protein